MLFESFRYVAARLIPRGTLCKQALVSIALVAGLAGCGGGGSRAPKATPWQTIAGAGYRFQAPAGWASAVHGGNATASEGSELEQVATFTLVHAYTPGLFTKVEGELSTRMGAVAAQTHGKVTGRRTVAVAGIRSHSYEVTVGDHVDLYTFVLRGKREFQLLCRRGSGDTAPFCERQISSFRF
jgi:hypothetical protein